MVTTDQTIIETLVGHRITAVASDAALTGGTIMRAAVEDNRARAEDLVDATIFVWVDDKRLPLLDIDGTDNGWYGLGYTVRVLAPGRTLTEKERWDASWDANCMPGIDE